MKNKVSYIWGAFGRFIPQVLYLITTMILARFLSPDVFGQIGVLSIVFTIANVLLDSGLGGSLIKEKDVSAIDCSSITCFNVLVSIVIYIILFIFAYPLEYYYNIDGLASVIRSISLVYPITAFGIVPKALLNRDLRFKESCFNSIIGVLVASIISITTAILGYGVYALVLYQLVVNAVTVLMNFISSKYVLSFKFSIRSLERLLPFGIYTSLITIIDTVYENLMTSLTGKYLSVQHAGMLYQAKRIEETLTSSLATALGTVSFPVLTKMKENLQEFRLEASSTFDVITSLTFPLLVMIAVFAKEIIWVLFGPNWVDASFYLKMLVIAGLFIIMETMIRNFIKALCEVKLLFYTSILKRGLGITIIVVSLFMSSSYMIYGYIVSTIVGFLLNAILYVYLIKDSFGALLRNSFIILLPSLLILFINELTLISTQHLLIRIALNTVILFFVYCVVLPLKGIHVLSYLSSLINSIRK